MYKCEKCQNNVPAKTKAHHLVIETRMKRYPERKFANKVKENGKIIHRTDPGGMGYETVQEIIVCPECAAKFEKNG